MYTCKKCNTAASPHRALTLRRLLPSVRYSRRASLRRRQTLLDDSVALQGRGMAVLQVSYMNTTLRHIWRYMANYIFSRLLSFCCSPLTRSRRHRALKTLDRPGPKCRGTELCCGPLLRVLQSSNRSKSPLSFTHLCGKTAVRPARNPMSWTGAIQLP